MKLLCYLVVFVFLSTVISVDLLLANSSSNSVNSNIGIKTAYMPEDLSFVPILLNASGYNPRLLGYSEPWHHPDPNFQLGLVNSEANMIRYPGGTFATYWNYDTDRLLRDKSTGDVSGWVDAVKIRNDATRERILQDTGPNGIQSYTVDNLKYAAKGGDSGRPVNIVFHMNMVTPGFDYYKALNPDWDDPVSGDLSDTSTWKLMLDDRYERFKRMLIRASTDDDPINIKFVELGNEYYFLHDYVNDAYDAPGATISEKSANYAIACNYIAGKILADFPEAIIAATASCVSGSSRWNDGLEPNLNKSLIPYVTMHMYNAFEDPDEYTVENFHTNLMNWLRGVNTKFANSGADNEFLRFRGSEQGWQIWYTETNANWDASVEENTPAHRSSWGRNLVDAFSTVHLYDKGKAAMLLQFQFNNQVIDANGNLHNRAKALVPYMRASRDAHAAAIIMFDRTAMPKIHTAVNKAVVQGYAFRTDSSEKIRCMLVNLSDQPVTIDLGNIYNPDHGSLTLTCWAHPDAGAINPFILPQSSSQPVHSVVLPAYSSNYIDDEEFQNGGAERVEFHVPEMFPTVKSTVDAIKNDDSITEGMEVVIHVAEGTIIDETIEQIGKAIRLTIQGAGADKTTLQGLERRPVPGTNEDKRFMLLNDISNNGLEITVKGIRFLNWGFGSSVNGGFISLGGPAVLSAHIHDCEFEGFASRAGAVFQSNNFNHSVTIDNCFIHNCLSYDDNNLKGLMNFVATGNISITNCTFMSNEQHVLNIGATNTGSDRGLREGKNITISQGSQNPNVIHLSNNVFVNNRVVDGGRLDIEKPVVSLIRNNLSNTNPYMFELIDNIFIGNSREGYNKDIDILFDDSGTGYITFINGKGNTLNSMVTYEQGSFVSVAPDGFLVDPGYSYTDNRIDFVMEGELPMIHYDEKGIGYLVYHGNGVDPYTFISAPEYQSFHARLEHGVVTLNGITPGEPVEIFSMMGQLVMRTTSFSDQMNIPLSRGLYVIRNGPQILKIFIP
jgi:hypothetical protein